MHTDVTTTDEVVPKTSSDNMVSTKEHENNNGSSISNWRLWCRLCAKEDPQSNISVFFKDEQQNGGPNADAAVCNDGGPPDVGLAVAIGKYFCVEIKRNEEMPKMLCTECFSLVTSLVNFSERVTKVQQMFCILNSTEMAKASSIDFHALRLKYGLLDEEREHVLVQQQLPEVHYFESKPKINDLEERIFGNETLMSTTSNPLEQPRIKIKIKKETLIDEELQAEDPDDEDDEEDEELDGENILNEEYEFDDSENEQKNYKHPSAEEEDDEDEKPLKLRIKTKQNLHKPGEEESPKEPPKKRRRRRRRKRKPLRDDDDEENDEDDEEEDKDYMNESNASEEVKRQENDDDDDNSYLCPDCPRRFKRVQHLRQHTKRAHVKIAQSAPLTCMHCSKVFTTPRQLDVHVKMHLPPDQRKVIPCPYCEKKFSTHTLMQTHIKYIHMNERPFICEECGVAVRTNAALKTHMLTHTDYAPFECDVCKKGFKNQIRLKNHMETHDPNKHVCAECGLQLNSRATLNRHLLVHSDEMQHKCDYCGRAFKRAKALKNHLILHTGLKPYSCDFCDRTFANGSNCRSHKKKAHPEELAALEAAGGGKKYTRNIPKLEALKAVTKAADNLAPVVSKQSGRFAFGKKLKNSPPDAEMLPEKPVEPKSENQNKQLSPLSSCSSLMLSGATPATDAELGLLHTAEGLQSNTSAASHMTPETAIPNIDNIYNHIMKQATIASHNSSSNEPDVALHITKRPGSQASCVTMDHDGGTSDMPTTMQPHQPNQNSSVTAMPSHLYSQIIKQNRLQQEQQQQQQQLHQQLHHHQQQQQHHHQHQQQQPQHHHLSHQQMQLADDVASSVRSPESQASSSHLDDQSNATAASVQFYNHIRQNLEGPYL